MLRLPTWAASGSCLRVVETGEPSRSSIVVMCVHALLVRGIGLE